MSRTPNPWVAIDSVSDRVDRARDDLASDLETEVGLVTRANLGGISIAFARGAGHDGDGTYRAGFGWRRF